MHSENKIISVIMTSNLAYDQRMQRILRCLYYEGYHLKVFSRKTADRSYHFSPENGNAKIAYEENYVPTFFQRSWLFYAEYNFRLFFKLLISRQNIIYAVDADTLMAVLCVRWLKGTKFIYDAHEFFEQSPEITGKKWIQKTWQVITIAGCRFSSLRITVGNMLADLLKKRYNKDFTVIRNIPDTAVTPSQISSRQKIIWYQGVLNIGRGLSEIIRCMPLLPEYSLILAGTGDIEDQLKDLVKKLLLQDRVIFKGPLSPAALIEASKSARIGINLLDGSNRNYFYSLANRTFDFINMELPAIHMNFPEYVMLLKKHHVGITISDLNQQTIINAVRSFENEQYYLQLVSACREAKVDYSSRTELLPLLQWLKKEFSEV